MATEKITNLGPDVDTDDLFVANFNPTQFARAISAVLGGMRGTDDPKADAENWIEAMGGGKNPLLVAASGTWIEHVLKGGDPLQSLAATTVLALRTGYALAKLEIQAEALNTCLEDEHTVEDLLIDAEIETEVSNG